MNHSISSTPAAAVFSVRGLVLFVGFGLIFLGSTPPIVQLGGLILAAFALVLLARARRRRKVGVGDYLITAVWVVACLSPIYLAVTKEPNAHTVEGREDHYRNLCPRWVEGNIWDKYVRLQDRAWCRNYEDRLAAEGLLTSRQPNSSASDAVSSTQLWK